MTKLCALYVKPLVLSRPNIMEVSKINNYYKKSCIYIMHHMWQYLVYVTRIYIAVLHFSGPSEVGPILVISEEFGADNVTVTVEWTQVEGVTYQIIIVPQTLITSIGESSIQLILLYNTNYNLSVESTLPCQHQAQSHVLLFYGEF